MKWISFIIEIAACIISFGICTAVIRAQFRPKDELSWWKYLVFGITFTAVTYFEVGSNLIASFIGMGICIFFAWRYFEGRFASKVISVIMINVLTILISIICLYVISAFSGVTMEKLTMYGNSMRLIEVCVMKSLCIFIAYAYIRTIKRQREFVQQELLISGIFFACFFVVSLFFIILLKQVMLPRILQIAFAVITLLFLGIILLVLWLLNHLQNQNRELLENSILRTQLREQEKLMKVSEESNQKIREVRHDIRRYFSNYLQLLEEGKVELVKKEMQKTFATKLSEKQQIYTPNLMLNAVINEKKEICEKNHIRFAIHVKLPENIDTIELAIALSNLLDNAIEAEQKEQEQEIHLNMEVVDEMFNLIVENHIQNSVLCVNPKLVTSKKNKAEHGLGIPTVREIVNQYQGFLNISEEANNMIVHMVIPLANFAKNR